MYDDFGREQRTLKNSIPLLISTGFLKYPLELKKKSVRTEKKIHLVYTEVFFQFQRIFFFILAYALSFYRSQNVLCWSNLFVPDQKIIYILRQSQTFDKKMIWIQ